MLTRAVRRLHPGQTYAHPGLFMLEITASLLSVLALRDAIRAAPEVSLEALAAIGLWAALLVIAAIRPRNP